VKSTEQQQRELETTSVSPATAKTLSGLFLLILFAIPISGLIFGNTLEGNTFNTTSNALQPAFYQDMEEFLESSSSIIDSVQPSLQNALTHLGGFGNDQVTLGHENWLFYEPGLRYVYGPDFNAQQGPLPHEAIIRLHEDCARLGIQLVVLPIPDKAMLQPWSTSNRFDDVETMRPLNNKGYTEFLNQLKTNGVDVFNIIPSEITRSETRYLENDTHWLPEFMESTAKKLAAYLQEKHEIPVTPRSLSIQVYRKAIQSEGDLTKMLNMVGPETGLASQEIVTNRIQHRLTAIPIDPDFEADVMLLGDSFTNIYSAVDLGWGDGAGLGERLSYELNHPIDVLAINGGGAYTVRRALARPENLERIAHKKVLIYQFSMRDLLDGDWRTVPLPETLPMVDAIAPSDPLSGNRQSRARKSPTPPPIKIVGQITKTSEVPRPTKAPYADCVSYIKLDVETSVRGDYDDSELLAIFFAMEKNKWLPPATFRTGDRLLLTLVPNRYKPERFDNMQIVDDTDDYTHIPFFVLEYRKLSPNEVIELEPDAADVTDMDIAEAPSDESNELSGPTFFRKPSMDAARARAIQETKRSILDELHTYGNGTWKDWDLKVTPFRRDLRAKIDSATPNNPGVSGRIEARSEVLPNNGSPILFEIAPKFYLEYLLKVGAIKEWNSSRKVARLIINTSRWFENRGIDLVVVPVPKLTEVYANTFSEMAPPDLRVAPHMRRLFYELSENDVEIIDLLPTFLAHQKAGNEPLYFPADNHWSQAGSILASQEIRKRLSRYEFIQDAIQAKMLFDTYVQVRRFDGVGLTALTITQQIAVSDALRENLVLVQGKGERTSEKTWLAQDSSVVVMGDSFVHYPDPGAVPSRNMLATLAANLNMPIADYSKGAQRLNDPLLQFLRDPSLLENCKVAVLVLNNGTIGRTDWEDLPQPILDELNEK